MKLFKKILSAVLSFGMIFSFAFSSSVFADGGKNLWEVKVSRFEPKTLEECCLALDEIFSPEEKEKIKQSQVGHLSSYLRSLSTRIAGNLGPVIYLNWLYKSGQKTELYKSFLEHGLAFDSDMDLGPRASGIILDNYQHYLLTGESLDSIEDLVIDHWYNTIHAFDPNFKREKLEKQMQQWKYRRDHPEETTVKSSPWWCIIM